jgi:hypothetical protein
MVKKDSLEDFINKAKLIHNNRFDYFYHNTLILLLKSI